jgi:hypothetical protein
LRLTLTCPSPPPQIPILTGDVGDEGSILGLGTGNITTDQETRDFVDGALWNTATDEQLDQFLEYYPADPALGSPFGTGNQYNVTGQNKRLSAAIGVSCKGF